MKHIAILLILCGSLATAQQWTWIHGANELDHEGHYGEQGVESAENMPPARASFASGISGDSIIYVFGGVATYGYKGDLWKYSIPRNQWTWVSGSKEDDTPVVFGPRGVPTDSAQPGSRMDHAGWVDRDGNVWIFGGLTERGHTNDLWRYSPITQQWTWMHGSRETGGPGTYGERTVPDTANTPGGRDCATTWVDSDGNLWLFGGVAWDSESEIGVRNDLWRYDTETYQWTWMHGSQETMNLGVYSKEVNPANTPSAREGAQSWVTEDGIIYLYGGFRSWTTEPEPGFHNDLWSYDGSNNQWLWLSGSKSLNSEYFLGTSTPGIPHEATNPGCRSFGTTWVDAEGRLWLFAGLYRYIKIQYYRNETVNALYMYDPQNGLWTYFFGEMSETQAECGELGISSPSNKPGSRSYTSAWCLLDGSVLMFGGRGLINRYSEGLMNDLWSLKPPDVVGVELISTVPEAYSISIAPNPVTGVATINYSFGSTTKITLQLHNQLGERVALISEGWQDPGLQTTQLNTAHLPSGTYYLRLSSATETKTRKMQIVK
ncbi:MAG: hypothetical protein CL946_07960 [Ectothiorhodospiraceae bacterium]|nr:hypothetical protein [Ectothiorhodospiraceae bacterium]